MIQHMLWVCAGILACLLTMRFRRPILDALKRFDDANVRRIAQQAQDVRDPNAHFRHTLEMAEEQVEEIQEIEVGDTTQYLFEAEMFLHRDEAEQARAQRVGVLARRFYAELPAALASRNDRAPLSARERAAQRWKRTIH